MGVNYQKLTEAFRRGPIDSATKGFKLALQEGAIDPWNVQLGAVFEELYGRRAFLGCRDSGELASTFMEAGDAVSSAAFANITGQIVYSALMASYNYEETVFSSLVKTVPTKLSGEKIAGIGGIGDRAAIVPEGEQYPLVGLAEDWIETPETVKRGMILPVTKEAVFFDRTNLLLSRAGELGKFMAINKEKRVIDAILGTTYGSGAGTTHRFKRKGSSWANFADGTAGTTHGVANIKAAASVLTDWTDIDEAMTLFAAMTDWHTGEPITIVPKQLIVAPTKQATAWRILNATDIELGAISATVPLVHSGTPPTGGSGLTIVSSQLLSTRMASSADWLIGDLGSFCWYMQNWPITVAKAPSNSHDEFNRDIVQQFKVSERGVPVIVDPHYMVVGDAA